MGCAQTTGSLRVLTATGPERRLRSRVERPLRALAVVAVLACTVLAAGSAFANTFIEGLAIVGFAGDGIALTTKGDNVRV